MKGCILSYGSKNGWRKSWSAYTGEIDELSVQKLQQKKPAALPFASPDMLAANTLMSGTAKEVLQIGRQLAELEEALDDVGDRLSDYRFTIFQINLMGKSRMRWTAWRRNTQAMRHFPIDDPYELCFALLYLLDADDDFVWVYSFMTGVACRAAYMLPWSIETYDEAYDGFWFDEDAWIQPQPLDSAWYEQNYIGDEDLEDDIVSDVSLAQLVYQSTGALLPRDMQRFDSGVKWLRRKGLKPSQASMLCAVMNILGEASRQQKYLPDGTTAETSPIEPAAAEQAAEENCTAQAGTDAAESADEKDKSRFEPGKCHPAGQAVQGREGVGGNGAGACRPA